MPKKAVSSKAKQPDFESSLEELEKIVERMEEGEQSLEESLKDFEAGIKLTRHCQQALSEAEQKVEILLEKNKTASPTPFDSDENE